MRQPKSRALPLLLSLMLGGCAALRGPDAARTPAAAAVLRLEVESPDPALSALLRRHLDLARVNALAGGEAPPAGEIDRLVAAAPQQARELLDTEGYYNAVIDVQRLGGRPPAVRLSVQPGPRTTVGRVQLDVQGPLAGSSEPVAQRARQALRSEWPLPEGRPFRADDWSAAKTSSLAGLRARGWVTADWASTRAEVDAATQRAALQATVSSGPLFRVGPLQVQGLQRQDERTVRRIADLQPGGPASEAMLLDIQERLQRSDLFDRATVTLLPDPAQPGQTPVRVQLSERKLQEATVGVGVGANVGPRVTLDHVHRRPFGKPWLARNALEWSRLKQRWDGELSTQTLPRLYRNLVGAGVERVESDTDVVTSTRLRVGRAQDTRRIDRQLFVEYQRSTTRSVRGLERDDALALQYHGIWRTLDDPVLPTRGRAWQGQLGAGVARSQPGDQGPFARLYARVDAYRPLGGRWLGQGRVEVGQVFARDSVRVPEALRFRAGGDESVRGHAYRSLTSTVDGVDVGGKVLFTGSLEASHPLSARIPALWGAVFVDVGRAALRWSELDPVWGAGAGLRYRSPVGPVKLDLAWGQGERRPRLHLSVGLAF